MKVVGQIFSRLELESVDVGISRYPVTFVAQPVHDRDHIQLQVSVRSYSRRRTVLKSSGTPEEEVARKAEKKKKEVQTNRQELTVGL